MLLECSGGIARLAIILWSEAQRNCLYYQRQFVTPDDIKEIYLGYSYSQIKNLADSFRYKNASLASDYPDVDTNFYKQHWQQTENSDESNLVAPVPSSAEVPTGSKPTQKRTEQAKFKSQQTAEKNKRAKSKLLKETLPQEDMRINGVINHHLDQLATLREKIED
jgi:predicted SPOUT superfamily RNA methylase MTH1